MRVKKLAALILCTAMLVTSAVPAAAVTAEMTVPDRISAKVSATAAEGWVRVGKEYKWRLSNGKILAKPGWYTLGGRRYYLGTGGVRRTGLFTTGSGIYYLSTSTNKVNRGMVLTGLRSVKIKGKTYRFYFDSAAKGAALKNKWKTVGGYRYYFGSDGRAYTGCKVIAKRRYAFSGSGKLIVNKYAYKVGSRYYKIASNGVMTQLKKQVEILAGIRLDKCKGDLKKAFNWSASLRYRSSVPGAKTAENYGLYGFKNGAGDCYVMACTFYWMAKAKGMDAHFVKGTFKKTNGKGNHGWVEIDEGGKTYVYDPNFTSQFKMNGYRITYGAKNTLKYLTHKRQN